MDIKGWLIGPTRAVSDSAAVVRDRLYWTLSTSELACSDGPQRKVIWAIPSAAFVRVEMICGGGAQDGVRHGLTQFKFPFALMYVDSTVKWEDVELDNEPPIRTRSVILHCPSCEVRTAWAVALRAVIKMRELNLLGPLISAVSTRPPARTSCAPQPVPPLDLQKLQSQGFDGDSNSVAGHSDVKSSRAPAVWAKDVALSHPKPPVTKVKSWLYKCVSAHGTWQRRWATADSKGITFASNALGSITEKYHIEMSRVEKDSLLNCPNLLHFGLLSASASPRHRMASVYPQIP